MVGSKALIASSLALQASAFLIPPKTPTPNANTGVATLANVTHVVELDCPGCPYASGNGESRTWEKDVENSIYLEFSTSSDGQLLINDQLPFDPRARATNQRLSAPQVRKSDEHLTNPIPLDYFLEQSAAVASEEIENSVVQIIPFKFTILGLDGVPVKVNSLSIELLKDAQSAAIAKIDQIPFAETPGATTCNLASRWSMCRFRALLQAAVQSFREKVHKGANAASSWTKHGGCGRHRQHGGKPADHDNTQRPHGNHPHKHHGHHHSGSFLNAVNHQAHRAGHMLNLALRFFFIPAVLGIVGGILTSAIGMMFGQFIVYLWRTFVRGGRRGRGVQLDQVMEIPVPEDINDEKCGLLATVPEEEEPEEALPSYTDTPTRAVVISENEERKVENF